MKKVFVLLLLAAPVMGWGQVLKAGLSISMVSSRYIGSGTNTDSYIDGSGGGFIELRTKWGVRSTIQYFRQRGSMYEYGEVSAYKTSLEVSLRRYLSDLDDNRMEWYVGTGVNVPLSISRESIVQERNDWGALFELGGMHGRWSGGFFFGISMTDILPDVAKKQHWMKWGLRADYALIN